MAKPIFIVRFPKGCSREVMMDGVDILSKIKGLNKDYHVIPLVSSGKEVVEFEVLNAVYAKDEDIEKIKEEVYKSLKQIKYEPTTEI